MVFWKGFWIWVQSLSIGCKNTENPSKMFDQSGEKREYESWIQLEIMIMAYTESDLT